jgi:glutathione S-transferase
MTVDLYYAPLSAPCRSVLMAAKAIGVTVNLKPTNPMAQETRTPEFIKMNVQHTIPLLDDEGFYVNESRAIMQYLANKYGKDDKLYPKDPKERAEVDMKLFFDMGIYAKFGNCYYPAMFEGQKVDEDVKGKLDDSLAFLEHYIGDSYVAGGNITIADYAIVSTLTTIEAVGHDLSKFPNIQAYLVKVKNEIEDYQSLNQDGADQFGEFAKAAFAKIPA